MEDELIALGWYYIGACACTPKKYKYKNDTYPGYQVRIIRSMNMFQIKQRNAIIAEAEAAILLTTLQANNLA